MARTPTDVKSKRAVDEPAPVLRALEICRKVSEEKYQPRGRPDDKEFVPAGLHGLAILCGAKHVPKRIEELTHSGHRIPQEESDALRRLDTSDIKVLSAVEAREQEYRKVIARQQITELIQCFAYSKHETEDILQREQETLKRHKKSKTENATESLKHSLEALKEALRTGTSPAETQAARERIKSNVTTLLENGSAQNAATVTHLMADWVVDVQANSGAAAAAVLLPSLGGTSNTNSGKQGGKGGPKGSSDEATQPLKRSTDPFEKFGSKLEPFMPLHKMNFSKLCVGDELHVYSAHEGSARCVAPNSDASLIVSIGDDKVIKKLGSSHMVLDKVKGDTIEAKLPPTAFAQEWGARSVALHQTVAEDGTDTSIALVGYYNGTLALWDLVKGERKYEVRQHRHTIKCIAISKDGKVAVTGSVDQTVQLWVVDTGISTKCFNDATGWINSVDISVSGFDTWIVAGSQDGNARIHSGQEDLTRQGVTQLPHGAPVTSVSMVSTRNTELDLDEKLVATGCDDKKLRVWDLESGIMMFSMDGHTAGITSVAISPTAQRIVTGSNDSTIRIWDGRTSNAALRSIKSSWEHQGVHKDDPVLCVQFTEDDKHVVFSTAAGRVVVLDASTDTLHAAVMNNDVDKIKQKLQHKGTKLCQLNKPLRSWFPLAIAIAQYKKDETAIVRRYDDDDDDNHNPDDAPETGGSSVIKMLLDETDDIPEFALVTAWQRNVAERVVLCEMLYKKISQLYGQHGPHETASSSTHVALADKDGKRRKPYIPQEILYCVSDLTSSDIRLARKYNISIDAKMVTSAVKAGNTPAGAKLFNAGPRKTLEPLKNDVLNELLTTIENKGSSLVDLYFGTRLHTIHKHDGAQVHCVTFSPCTKYIYSGSSNNKVHEWSQGFDNVWRSRELPFHHRFAVLGIAATDHKVITAAADTTVRVYDKTQNKLTKVLHGHKDWVRSIALTDAFAVTCSDDTTILCWNIDDPTQVEPIGKLEGHSKFVLSVAATKCTKQKDHYIIASGCADCNILVHSVQLQGGNVVDAVGSFVSLEQHEKEVYAVDIAYELDRHLYNLVSGSADHTILIWHSDIDNTTGWATEWQKRHLLRTPLSESSPVRTVQLSRDCRYIVSGADDTTVRTWDVVTGELLHSLPDHCGIVHCVSLTNKVKGTGLDGARIVSSSSDTTIMIWDAKTVLDTDEQDQSILHRAAHEGNSPLMKVVLKDFKAFKRETAISSRAARAKSEPDGVKPSTLGPTTSTSDAGGGVTPRTPMSHGSADDHDNEDTTTAKQPGAIKFVDWRNKQGKTALHISAEEKHAECVTALLEAGADPSIQDQHLQIAATLCKDDRILHTLLQDKYFNPRKKLGNYTALHLAVLSMNAVATKHLLTRGVEVDATDPTVPTALQLALEDDMNPVAKLLLTHGANPNTPNKNKWTLLHTICNDPGNPHSGEILKQLIESGGDIHAATDDNSTPLAIAAQAGNVQCMKILVSNPLVDIEAPSRSGKTPLLRIADQGGAMYGKDNRLECMHTLMERSPNVNHVDKYGFTALHLILRPEEYNRTENMPKMVQLLLNNGADPDIKTYDLEEAALHLACTLPENEFTLQAIHLLAGADCNVDIQTKKGETAYRLAREQGNEGVKDYLASVGADIFLPRNTMDKAKMRHTKNLPPIVGLETTISTLSDTSDRPPTAPDVSLSSPPHPTDAINTQLSTDVEESVVIGSGPSSPLLAGHRSRPTTVAQSLKFGVYMIAHGLIIYPHHLFYHYALGTSLTKILNYTVTTYDNEQFWPGPMRTHFSKVVGVCMLMLWLTVPFIATVLGTQGYHTPAVVLFYVVLVSWQSLTLLKAAADKLYFRVNHEVTKLKLLKPNDANLKAWRKIKLIKVGNIPPLLSILIDFGTYSAFVFSMGANAAPEEQSADAKKFFLTEVFDKFLLEIGTDVFTLTVYIIHAVVGCWLFLYAYIITSQAILQKQETRKKFSFLKDTTLDKTGFDTLVGLLSGSLFSTVTKIYFQTIDCSTVNGQGDLILEAAEDQICWKSSHPILAASCMMMCYLYIMTATTQMLYFREPRNEGYREIQYIGFFLLLENVLKTIIGAASVMVDRQPSYISRITGICLFLMLVATITLKPCSIKEINFLRIGVYACSVTSIFVAFLLFYFPKQVDQGDVFVAWVVVILIVYLVYKGVPHRRVDFGERVQLNSEPPSKQIAKAKAHKRRNSIMPAEQAILDAIKGAHDEHKAEFQTALEKQAEQHEHHPPQRRHEIRGLQPPLRADPWVNTFGSTDVKALVQPSSPVPPPAAQAHPPAMNGTTNNVTTQGGWNQSSARPV